MTASPFPASLDQLLVESAIHTLYARYAQTADALDVAGLTGLFAEGGKLTVAGNSYTGSAAMTEWMERVAKSVTVRGRHIVSNILINWQESAATVVTATADMIVVSRTATDAPLSVIAAGRYEDTFVKTDAGWRFQEREIMFG